MENDTLLTLTADIVSAHVAHNKVSAGDVPTAIQSVFAALSQAGQPASAEEEALISAVSVRSSVKPDAITCLDCGKKFKTLKRHLAKDHDLTPGEYRQRWNLPADYPMVSPNYSATRKELAVKIGLGRKGDVESVSPAPEPKSEPQPD